MIVNHFDKLFVSLRYYLTGRRYFTALKALDFARSYHKGMRKDGETPEFQHQVEIALYLTTLRDVQNEELVITASLLHDVMEDYDIPREELETKFGPEVTRIVWLLTKKYKGRIKDPKAYFHDIGEDPTASLVKGADRIHNVQTMVGVFSTEKQKTYVAEVELYFIPMLKRAKYVFPEQTAAYFNILHVLRSQLGLLKALHSKS